MAPVASDLDRFLHAIADPMRRRILQVLKVNDSASVGKEGGLCATDIEQKVKLAQPTVSHHMRILETAGLVESKREGHWRRYVRKEKRINVLLREMKRQL